MAIWFYFIKINNNWEWVVYYKHSWSKWVDPSNKLWEESEGSIWLNQRGIVFVFTLKTQNEAIKAHKHSPFFFFTFFPFSRHPKQPLFLHLSSTLFLSSFHFPSILKSAKRKGRNLNRKKTQNDNSPRHCAHHEKIVVEELRIDSVRVTCTLLLSRAMGRNGVAGEFAGKSGGQLDGRGGRRQAEAVFPRETHGATEAAGERAVVGDGL